MYSRERVRCVKEKEATGTPHERGTRSTHHPNTTLPYPPPLSHPVMEVDDDLRPRKQIPAPSENPKHIRGWKHTPTLTLDIDASVLFPRKLSVAPNVLEHHAAVVEVAQRPAVHRKLPIATTTDTGGKPGLLVVVIVVAIVVVVIVVLNLRVAFVGKDSIPFF